MITPFTYEEGSLLLRLLIAHCITDFLLQSERGVKNKMGRTTRSAAFWLHVLYTGLVAGLLMGAQFSWQMVAIITVSHGIIDFGKIILTRKIDDVKNEHRDLWLFVADQLLHVGVLVMVWLLMIDGMEKMKSLIYTWLPDYRFLLMALAYLVIIGPVTYLIRFLTCHWAKQMDDSDGLENAGKWIGMLERIIILTLVFIEQYTAIGFLVTAKSILRVIDKPAGPRVEAPGQRNFSSRKHTEYVLIGTFLSYGAAILTGLLFKGLLH